METYEVGQEVLVFNINGKRAGQPEGGWPGTIIKVGRKNVTIKYGSYHTFTFSMETQRQTHLSHTWFKTLEQAAEDARRSSAIDRIRLHGLSFSSSGHRQATSTTTLERVAEVLEQGS